MEKLNEVQTRLANFQKLYWFETVAGRREATHFLNQLQEETGTRQSYNEFRRQLDLQKEIVDTHHQELQEERSAQRQVTGERRCYAYRLSWYFIGNPGLIELFLFEIPLGAKAIIIVAAYLVLLVFVILSFRDILNIKGCSRRTATKSSRNSTLVMLWERNDWQQKETSDKGEFRLILCNPWRAIDARCPWRYLVQWPFRT